ncbi:MAG: sodium-dependent bicarbonate transport family permease [Alphaproteobacteria bacterium]|nr:sodium-dependent bicarbonate transport family permease [Alphaproteobacteria bacterium]
MLAIAKLNLLSPIILFFVLGFVAGLSRARLEIPENIGKFLALYLMMAIGFKGGVALSSSGISADAVKLLAIGMSLSLVIPLVGYAIARRLLGMSVADAAALSAHYGSVSVVTFVAATSFLEVKGVEYGSYMVAVVAAMETPAIMTALFLIGKNTPKKEGKTKLSMKELMHEVFLNGSVVMLLGAFIIGLVTGDHGQSELNVFITSLFKGVLCFFLLDTGLKAATSIVGKEGEAGRKPSIGHVAFGIGMPLLGAFLAHIACRLFGVTGGDAMVMTTLAASASYIAVPAAMKIAIPEADTPRLTTIALAVTFPFNVIVGIPLYAWLAGV